MISKVNRFETLTNHWIVSSDGSIQTVLMITEDGKGYGGIVIEGEKPSGKHFGALPAIKTVSLSSGDNGCAYLTVKYKDENILPVEMGFIPKAELPKFLTWAQENMLPLFPDSKLAL